MCDDHSLAETLARDAGEALVGLQAKSVGMTPETLQLAGDALSHKLLVTWLRDFRPGDAVRSEEDSGEGDRIAVHRRWVIDPVDGSHEYGERKADWAVHVALVVDKAPVAGAVAIPSQERVDSTASSSSERFVSERSHGRVRIVASRSRTPGIARILAEQLGADIVTMGSAGVKAMAVVSGDADIYVHAGGQYEWDSAAPVAVARSKGLAASRLDGSPLVYDQSNPWLPDVLICRADLADQVIVVARGVTGEWQ